MWRCGWRRLTFGLDSTLTGGSSIHSFLARAIANVLNEETIGSTPPKTTLIHLAFSANRRPTNPSKVIGLCRITGSVQENLGRGLDAE